VSAVHKLRIEDALITRSIAGDPRSREQLAAACLPHVWRTVYLASGGGQDVEDLVQSAMAQAFADLPRFRAEGTFVSWLHRVTLNVVRQHFRRRAVRAFLPFAGDVEELPDRRAAPPEAALSRRRLLDRLAHHLGGLGHKNRAAVVLSISGGYSASEIALIVGCGAETAKKRLQRGREELVARLAKDPAARELIEEMGR
jgi:RNA polymerase sigma-70 factor (ECF subfamily)